MAAEQQFVLRVADTALANHLRRCLREETAQEGGVELHFRENGREGELLVNGQVHKVHVLDLPTVVESYKTYDDENLVKTGDIGQVLVVGGSLPTSRDFESEDGLTPPMRRARIRHLRSKPGVDRQTVQKWEQAIVDILLGGAPEGTTFHDIEEEWVVDTHTGRGSWKPVPPAPRQRPASNAARDRDDDGMDDDGDDDDMF